MSDRITVFIMEEDYSYPLASGVLPAIPRMGDAITFLQSGAKVRAEVMYVEWALDMPQVTILVRRL